MFANRQTPLRDELAPGASRYGLRLNTPLPLPPASRNGHISLSTFSPVNPNGSFEFDKVLKAGRLLRRTTRTKSWKAVYIVLRPNLLSVYKDSDESRLRIQINLSDLTAVVLRKDRKGRQERAGVFGLYSPSKNYYFDAGSQAGAQEWIQAIRGETRIDEQNQHVAGMVSAASQTAPILPQPIISPRSPLILSPTVGYDLSSSPESMPDWRVRQQSLSRPIQIPIRQASQPHGFSSHDYASQSDGSVVFGSARSSISQTFSPGSHPGVVALDAIAMEDATKAQKGHVAPTTTFAENDRVIWHGFMYCMRFQRGVRQWKKYWAVLRNKHLALYKGQEEYAALLIIPISSIVDVVEVDALSKSKKFCMQVITDDRSFRFCAITEDELAHWLGSFKSLLTKKANGQLGVVSP